MADPQVLYIVSAVVVLALVAWVIAVVARAPALPYARKNPETMSRESAAPAAAAPVAAPSPKEAEAPKPEAPPAESQERVSRLDAHLEIQDAKASEGDGKPGEG
jgi:hypothetical protein